MCFKPFTKSQLLSGPHDTKIVGQSVAWITASSASWWHCSFLSFTESHLEGTSGLTVLPDHRTCTAANLGHSVAQCWCSVIRCTFLEERWNFQNPSSYADVLHHPCLEMHCFTSKGYVFFTALAEHSKCNLESEVFTFHGYSLLTWSVKSFPISVDFKISWLEHSFCDCLPNRINFDLTWSGCNFSFPPHSRIYSVCCSVLVQYNSVPRTLHVFCPRPDVHPALSCVLGIPGVFLTYQHALVRCSGALRGSQGRRQQPVRSMAVTCLLPRGGLCQAKKGMRIQVGSISKAILTGWEQLGSAKWLSLCRNCRRVEHHLPKCLRRNFHSVSDS